MESRLHNSEHLLFIPIIIKPLSWIRDMSSESTAIRPLDVSHWLSQPLVLSVSVSSSKCSVDHATTVTEVFAKEVSLKDWRD